MRRWVGNGSNQIIFNVHIELLINKFNKNITMKSHTACVQLILVLKSDALLFLEEQTCSEETCWTG